MGIVTDNKGNVVGEFADTLEDWKQAAEVEAGLRREFQEKLSDVITWLRRNANSEKEPKARAAFIEAHNAALKIAEGRNED